MNKTLTAGLIFGGGYWITGKWIDAPMKKEIRWQLFEIEGANGFLRDHALRGEEPDSYTIKTIQEIERRNELITDLSSWLDRPLWERWNTDPPRNDLCDYI